MDQEKIWNFFQNDHQIGSLAFNGDARYHFLASQISPNAKVLNIGVGRGGLESLLLLKGADVYSLDPSSEAIESLRAKFGLGEKACVGYSQKAPFADGSFDVIVMSEVLEHLSDDVINKTLTECCRLLSSDGVFIGTVPADEVLTEGMTVCPCCGSVFHRWGHVQTFTKMRLASLLKEQFSTCVVERKFFGSWASLNWKGRMNHIIKKTLLRLGAKGSGENFFFLARKR